MQALPHPQAAGRHWAPEPHQQIHQGAHSAARAVDQADALAAVDRQIQSLQHLGQLGGIAKANALQSRLCCRARCSAMACCWGRGCSSSSITAAGLALQLFKLAQPVDLLESEQPPLGAQGQGTEQGDHGSTAAPLQHQQPTQHRDRHQPQGLKGLARKRGERHVLAFQLPLRAIGAAIELQIDGLGAIKQHITDRAQAFLQVLHQLIGRRRNPPTVLLELAP